MLKANNPSGPPRRPVLLYVLGEGRAIKLMARADVPEPLGEALRIDNADWRLIAASASATQQPVIALLVRSAAPAPAAPAASEYDVREHTSVSVRRGADGALSRWMLRAEITYAAERESAPPAEENEREAAPPKTPEAA